MSCSGVTLTWSPRLSSPHVSAGLPARINEIKIPSASSPPTMLKPRPPRPLMSSTSRGSRGKSRSSSLLRAAVPFARVWLLSVEIDDLEAMSGADSVLSPPFTFIFIGICRPTANNITNTLDIFQHNITKVVPKTWIFFSQKFFFPSSSSKAEACVDAYEDGLGLLPTLSLSFSLSHFFPFNFAIKVRRSGWGYRRSRNVSLYFLKVIHKVWNWEYWRDTSVKINGKWLTFYVRI